jgi:hypothetical protein
MKYIFLPLLLALATNAANAWDGTDQDSGDSVEIEQGNLVRSGENIEYYDSGKGEYRTGDVESITRYGSTVEVEITDDESGETRTLEMED